MRNSAIVSSEITDPQILEYFNGQKMRVVINNHLQGPDTEDSYSDFIVKSFSFTPFEPDSL